MIMAIAALDMKARGKLGKNTVVGTIMTNFGFTKFCADNDIRFVATKVGDRYVLEEMLLEDYYLGGEQSGHIIFRDFSTTGDGQLTAVQILSQLKRTGEKLSEAAKVMTRYPQFIVNIPCTSERKVAFYTDYEVKSIIEDAKKEIGDSGRLIARSVRYGAADPRDGGGRRFREDRAYSRGNGGKARATARQLQLKEGD